MAADNFTVVHPCATGLDVHKMQITAAVRRQTTAVDPEVAIRAFSALPSGLEQLCERFSEQNVDAALMEATGVYWQAPFEALEDTGIPVMLVHAQHVKQITVATAHKLLRVIWAVLRDREPYRDPEVDYDELVVHRNAPRWIAQLQKFGYVGTPSFKEMEVTDST